MAYPGKTVPGMLREVLRSSKLPINAQIHDSPKSTVFEPTSYSPKVHLGINLLTYKWYCHKLLQTFIRCSKTIGQ